MTIEYIRYALREHDPEELVGAYARAAAFLDASPWCRGYALSRCVEDPRAHVLRIEWTSVQDHLRGFRRSPEFRSFLAEIRPFVDEIEEMRHYEPTAVAG